MSTEAGRRAWKFLIRRRAELLEQSLLEALGPGLRSDAAISKVREVVSLVHEGIDRGAEVTR